MKKNRGFSLIEAMIVLGMIGLIMGAIYAMILHFRDVSGGEQARVRQTQENRFIFTSFFTELSNSGCLATNARSYAIAAGLIDPNIASQYILFNGVFPLNNTTWPDGVIMASGDPACVGKIAQEMTPSSSISVTLEPSPLPMPWQQGDQGMLLGLNGYYVFRVAGWDPVNLTLTMAAPAIYYSGLLNSPPNYQDQAQAIKIVNGREAHYPMGCLAMRITTFSIYLIQQRLDPKKNRNIRELVRITDTAEIPDALGSTDARVIKSVISQNIWDLQVVYNNFPNFPSPANPTYFFTNELNPNSNDLDALLSQMDKKLIKDVTLHLVTLTDDYPGKGTAQYTVRPFADRAAAYTLPRGKFTHRVFSINVYPKNFGVKI